MVHDKCIVPSCQYRRRGNSEKRTLFQCPKDELQAHKWALNIPGITKLLRYQSVCEIHFEERFKTYVKENVTGTIVRSRLRKNAVPTLFHCVDNETSGQVPAVFSDDTFVPNLQTPIFYDDIYNHPVFLPYIDNGTNIRQVPTTTRDTSVNEFEVSKIVLRDNPSKSQKNVETSLQNVIQNLRASEHQLINIKQEELSQEDSVPHIKTENSDFNEQPSIEEDCEMKELSVYKYLQKNFHYFTTLLPESWSISPLPVDNDKIFMISKECPVNENEGLIIMYEKNIVINRSGNTFYSIHGKRLNINDALIPKLITNTETLLKVILQFDEMKVCQGIYTQEFEVDKDTIIYKDDLGYCRHVDCVLMTDKQQCDPCHDYNQYLLSKMRNNIPVITDKQLYYCNQIYSTNFSR